MKQPEVDSEFEAFRRDRNVRRQQLAETHRPAGQNDVWDAIEANEKSDLQDRLINAEVDEFFTDATKMAATIVQRVARGRELELSERLRKEMEEFLTESIRHANNLMDSLPSDPQNYGETVVDANLKNLDGRELDEFRAEGTAQLADKHFGQNPFPSADGHGVSFANPEPAAVPQGDATMPVPPPAAEPTSTEATPPAVVAASAALDSMLGTGPVPTTEPRRYPVAMPVSDMVGERVEASTTDDDDEMIGKYRMHISELELALDSKAEQPDFEAGQFTDHISGVAGLSRDEQPMRPPTVSGVYRAAQGGQKAIFEDDLPLAALFESNGDAMEIVEPVQEEPAPGVAASDGPTAKGASAETDDKSSNQELIRETLLGLVRQGIMTKEQARAAYMAQTKAL